MVKKNIGHEPKEIARERSPHKPGQKEMILEKKITRLERLLAQKESEAWTLKQLLLYK